MSKSLWLFVLSFIIWIPLGYIVLHRYDGGSVPEEHPIKKGQNAHHISLSAGSALTDSTSVDKAKQLSPELNINKEMSSQVKPFNPEAEIMKNKLPAVGKKVSSFSSSRLSKPLDFKIEGGMGWSEFVQSPYQIPLTEKHFSLNPGVHLLECSASQEQQLHKPKLSAEDFSWCQWALSPSGGMVKVGKTYGKLRSTDKMKYENLNCNDVANGKNPSCDDAWGDGFVRSWRENSFELCGGDRGDAQYTSQVRCMDSTSTARFCVFENAVMDFTKMIDVARPGRETGSRKWEKGFLGTHCDKKYGEINYFDFYKPVVNPQSTRCDYVVNHTVLAYSHDDIHNLGHSMSDFMNVWLMMWLSKDGANAKDIKFLNIDAIRMGHNYNDVLSQFGMHYDKAFASVMAANQFAKQPGGRPTVCFKRLIMQPRPVVLFTWDGWWNDVECTFLGPSTMFQRWNLQLRQNYGLLDPVHMPTAERVQVLLLIRAARANGGSHQSSRVFQNTAELVSALRKVPGVDLVAVDLSTLPFEQQVRLVANSSVLIGMHGAGIPASMHMPVGTKHCCGVIEIFPDGEFKSIRGYGNMARRMGHHYERIALTGKDRRDQSTNVPPQLIVQKLGVVLENIKTKPSCILPAVLDDPFFQK